MVGIVEHAANDRLQAGDAHRLADAWDIEPHIVSLTQRGAPLVARWREEQRHHLVAAFFHRIQHELLLVAAGIDVDELAVHLVGLGLEVAVDFLRISLPSTAAIAGSASSRASVSNMRLMFMAVDPVCCSACDQTWRSAVIGSMREAFHAGCRLARPATTITMAAVMMTSDAPSDGDSSSPCCWPKL
jgi:hypothetical protein